MKLVVFVTHFYPPHQGGAETLAVNLARTASRMGHDVTLLSLYRRDDPLLAEVHDSVAASTGSRIAYLGVPRAPRPHHVLMGVLRLRRLLAQLEPDVIEASMVGPSTIAALATKGTAVRCVLGIHATFNRAMHRGPRFALFRAAVRLNPSSLLYFVSESSERAFERFLPRLPHRRAVIHNVVDEVFFDEATPASGIREDLGLPGDARLVLTVGSLVRNKGIDIALDACAPLLDAGDTHLLFVGKAGKHEDFHAGSADFYERFYARVNGEFAGRAHLLGHRTDIAGLMRDADVLLVASRSEASPLVIAEAMASGLPVVATRVGGIPDLLLDGEVGALCAAEDAAAYTAALRATLGASESQRQEQRSCSRQRAEDFRPERRVRRLLEFADAST